MNNRPKHLPKGDDFRRRTQKVREVLINNPLENLTNKQVSKLFDKNDISKLDIDCYLWTSQVFDKLDSPLTMKIPEDSKMYRGVNEYLDVKGWVDGMKRMKPSITKEEIQNTFRKMYNKEVTEFMEVV